MNRVSANRSRREGLRRRGGILLEVLVAIAIFAATAGVVLGMISDALAALSRSQERAAAVDVARSALARLEAGLLTITDLRAGRVTSRLDESPDADSGAEADVGTDRGDRNDDAVRAGLAVDVSTRRADWSGLSLIELRVRRIDADPDSAPLCTLRQLVRLREASEESTPSDPLRDAFEEARDAE